MFATLGLVLGFRSSSALAAAYGIAVTLTMVITTMLAYLVARGVVGRATRRRGLDALFFLVIELAFFGANVLKIAHGGWFPLVDRRGRLHCSVDLEARAARCSPSRLRERLYPFDRFLKDIDGVSAAARQRHGRLHDQQPARHAADAAAQPASTTRCCTSASCC